MKLNWLAHKPNVPIENRNTMARTKKSQKRVVVPPGRKLTPAKARQLVNKQFGKAFEKLAK